MLKYQTWVIFLIYLYKPTAKKRPTYSRDAVTQRLAQKLASSTQRLLARATNYKGYL